MISNTHSSLSKDRAHLFCHTLFCKLSTQKEGHIQKEEQMNYSRTTSPFSSSFNPPPQSFTATSAPFHFLPLNSSGNRQVIQVALNLN